MKAQSSVYIIIILLIGTLKLNGQLVSIGQASDNKLTRSEPARLVATYPGEDTVKNNFLINTFVSVNIHWLESTISLIGEIQQNTLINKEQNVLQLGGKIEKSFALIQELNVRRNHSIQKLLLYSEMSVKYSSDRIKDEKSLQMIFSNSFSIPTPFDNEWLNLTRPFVIWPPDENNKHLSETSKWIQYKHMHNIGLEYIGNDDLVMINGSFSIELYPLSGLLYTFVQKYGILQLRWIYINHFDISDADTRLYIGPQNTYGAALNYKFDPKGESAISIGYEYIKGGNPLKGLDKVEYGTVTFNAKVNL